MKPWIDRVAQGRSYVFQQDSVPAYKAKVTQEWLAKSCDDHATPNIWPPSSPDLNPMDYYVWGVVEMETNKRPHSTKESLKATILHVMGSLQEEPLIRACSRFRNRLEAVIEAEGGFIE